MFTHDDRLPEACRRLALEPTVLEAHRGERSQVVVRCRDHPALMYLGDAHAVLNTPGYPGDALRRVIPGLWRNAVESAASDVTRHRLMTAGRSFDDVEAALASASGLRRKLALALHDAEHHADVRATVRARWGAPSAGILDVITKGAHEAIERDAEGVVRDTRTLVRQLLALVDAA